MTTATGDTINYNYDGLKRLSSTAIKNSSGTTLFRTGYSYKAGTATNQTTNRISVYTTWDPNYAALYSYGYVYDSVGNIIQIKDAKNSNRVIAAYTYDVQNQLIEETIYSYSGTSTTPSNTTSYEYTYDTAGNILTEIKNCVVTKTYTYGNSNWNDLLTAVNGNAIIYDAIGNPTTYRNGEMTSYNTPVTYYMDWEQGRQLSYLEIWGETQNQIEYSYDLEGIRTQKVVDGTVHSYVTQNGKVVRETIGTGSSAKVLDFIYDASGRPFALKYKNGTAATETYYYVLNLQGDVVALMTASRETKAEYTYNAWGEVLTATGTMASVNPLRYRGYYYDAETGFYYLQSRYYDPTIRRFINADSLASTGQGITGTNMFAYCGNNPIAFKDSNGDFAVAITVGVAATGAYVITIAVFGIVVATYELLELAGEGLEWIEEQAEKLGAKIFYDDSVYISVPAIRSSVKSDEETTSKVAVAESSRTEIKNYSYWEAQLIGNRIVVGRGLTLQEAAIRVSCGGNLMCKNDYAARAILYINRYWGAVGPEKSFGEGFYWHYHPHRNTHTHIWFYGQPLHNATSNLKERL